MEYELKIFGATTNNNATVISTFSSGVTPFNFGFPKPSDPVFVPVFSNIGAPSIFDRPATEVAPPEFTFGSGLSQTSSTMIPGNSSSAPSDTKPPNLNSNDVQMEGL